MELVTSQINIRDVISVKLQTRDPLDLADCSVVVDVTTLDERSNAMFHSLQWRHNRKELVVVDQTKNVNILVNWK